MNELKRLFYLELIKIKQNKTFLITILAAICYGTIVVILIGNNKNLTYGEVAAFVTNPSIILIITPIIIDYPTECSIGYFQDAVSTGIGRRRLFFVKKNILLLQSLLIVAFLYGSILTGSMIRGLSLGIDAMSILRLFLYSLCIFYLGFMFAVILERIFTVTVCCALLSIGLAAFGSMISRTFIYDYYIFGKNTMIFQTNLPNAENNKFILCSVVTILILFGVSYLRFLKTEFKTDNQDF